MRTKEKRPEGAPTVDDIKRWKEELEDTWKKQHDKDQDVADIYFGENDLDLPSGDKQIVEPYEIRMGRGAEICDHITGILDVEPIYSMDAPGKAAEAAEKWANLARWTAEREQGEDTNSRMTGEAVMPGWSCVVILPNPSYWKGKYPKQGYDRDRKKMDEDEGDEGYNKRQEEFGHIAPFPISIWHAPARTAYPLLNGRNVIKLLQCKKVTKSYIEARYGDKLDGEDRDKMKSIGKDDLELVEYVDDTYCGYYLLGTESSKLKKELRVWAHRMPLPKGQAPVVLVEGFTTADARPGYRWKSLLEDLKDALEAQDLGMSQLLSAVVTFFSLTILHTIKPGAQFADTDLETLRTIREFVIGGTNFKLPNEEIEVMGAPENLPNVESLLNKLEERINRAIPPVLLGDVSGSSSGYEADVGRRTALMRVKPLGKRLAQADADIMRMVFYALGGLAKILNKPDIKVYVREPTEDGIKAIGLSWNDVKDLVALLRAKRVENFPEDIHSLIDACIKAWKELGLPWRIVIERILGWEDPEALKEERDIENIIDSPLILEKTEQDTFREMELILDEQEGMDPLEVLDPDAPEMPPGYLASMGLPPEALTEHPQSSNGGAPVTVSPNVQTTNPRRGTRTRNRGSRRKAGKAMAPANG